MKERSEEYFKFRFPKEAMDEIREYVALNDDLYTSYIEFCIEAIRTRLDEILEEMHEEEKVKGPSVKNRADAIRKRLGEITRENAKQNAEEIKKLNKERE